MPAGGVRKYNAEAGNPSPFTNLIPALIEIQNLQKVIDGNTAIDIQRLLIGAGEVAGISGPAGSGKTLLLSLLIGRTPPSAGSIRVAELDPTRQRSALLERVGVVTAENGLYGRLSARANLAFFGRLWKLPPERVDQALSQVGLADHANQRAGRLSPSLARRRFSRTGSGDRTIDSRAVHTRIPAAISPPLGLTMPAM